jgi:ubiquinone/menaquinone biosynthesis C-methylase UbiE
LVLAKNVKTFLDVGCGPALTYEYLCKNNIEVEYTGVDLCRGFIEYNKKTYPEANFVRGKSYKLPFKDKAFDFVTARHVLEHLREPYSTIAEMCRVSDRVGIIFFMRPAKEEIVRRSSKGFYKNIYSRQKLEDFVEELGFNMSIIPVHRKYERNPLKEARHQLWYLTR